MSDRPAERYDGTSAEEIALRWRLPAVYLYERVGSTNDVARALAGRGAPAGTLVLADEQAAGRGRGGRGWSSPPGLGVWMSMVLRPAALPAPGLLPILVGLAAAEALDPFARPARVMVKWPNDLQLAGRKLAGILCEASWEAGGPSFVVAGIGINVVHAPGDFPPELRDAAASLRSAAGWAPPRGEVAGAVAAAVFRRLAEPPPALGAALLAELEGRDALRGRPVRVSGPEPVAGVAAGIGPNGALRVRAGSELRTVTAGTVRLAGGRVDAPAPSG